MRERIGDFFETYGAVCIGFLLGISFGMAFVAVLNVLVPINQPKASVVHGPVEFLPLVDAGPSEDAESLDAGIEEDLMTKETSGYCGCQAACCLEFSYDSNSGCHLCEVLP